MDDASIAEQLKFLVTAVTAIQKKQDLLETLVNRVNTLENTVSDQQKAISQMASEIKELKNDANHRDQQARICDLRLFNFPGSGDETGLAAKVYELLKPVLVAAKAKGDTQTVPQMGNVIADVFRAGRFSPGKDKPPPPVIIKCVSPLIRLAILRNKKDNLPSPSEAEKEAGVKKFIITEDLTTPTYKKYRELLSDDRVQRAWTINGEIWVVKNVLNPKAFKIKSVYDSNDTILS